MTILNFKRKDKLQSTSAEQLEQQPTPTFTEGQTNSTSSRPPITNEQIAGTPFRIINLPEKGWFLTLGNQRIGEMHETKNEAIQPLLNKDWMLICNVIVTLIEQVNNITKELNQTNNGKD